MYYYLICVPNLHIIDRPGIKSTLCRELRVSNSAEAFVRQYVKSQTPQHKGILCRKEFQASLARKQEIMIIPSNASEATRARMPLWHQAVDAEDGNAHETRAQIALVLPGTPNFPKATVHPVLPSFCSKWFTIA